MERTTRELGSTREVRVFFPQVRTILPHSAPPAPAAPGDPRSRLARTARYTLLLLALTVAGPTSVATATGLELAPALAREVAHLASTRERPLVVDPSLTQAAERHAREVVLDERAARLDRVELALRAEGLADAQVLPFTSVGSDPAALGALLTTFARDTARERGLSHVGVALVASGQPKRFALSAIFSRRLVELAPLPHTAGDRFPVRGRVQRDVEVEVLLLGPCRRPGEACSGEVRALAHTIIGGLLTVDLALDRGPGHYTFELLATRDRGPEVSALWSFAHEVGRVAGTAPQLPRTRQDVRALGRLVEKTRDAHDLAPLSRQAALDRAAARHAAAVCRRMIAAHVLPGEGSTPPERAARAGYAGRVSENVAIAASVARAHENLLATPSHRRNVLDPAARTLGVGVASTEPGAGGRSYCVVELFGFDDDDQGAR